MKKLYLTYLFVSLLCLGTVGCSSDDNDAIDSEQFVTANINGLVFNSDINMQPLGFSRTLTPDGRINLYAKALSTEGNIIEILIDNYQGPGKYFFGDHFYNSSWVKFNNPATSEIWGIGSSGALNKHSNFIEITSIKDKYIEGKIGCSEMVNNNSGPLGAMEGEFRLISFD